MRELLLLAEASSLDQDEFATGFVDLENSLSSEDFYQLYLMKDAEWIDGRDAESGYFRVTSAGHDYLDATRDKGIWKQTKDAVLTNGGSMTLEIVKQLAIGFAQKQLEDRTGFKL